MTYNSYMNEMNKIINIIEKWINKSPENKEKWLTGSLMQHSDLPNNLWKIGVIDNVV